VTSGTYTVGTTAINWTQFSTPGIISVGNGLTKNGTVVSLTSPVSASDLPVGAVSSTVAAGDDPRIVNAVRLINTDGDAIANAVIVKGVVLTDENGGFTFDYSAAALTHVHSVQVTVVHTSSDLSLAILTNIHTFSEVKTMGSLLSIGDLGLGLAIAAVGENTSVSITVIGDQA
jgi:hypothetical protein